MPSKSRWALNPRKWFGTISNAAHKREQKSQGNNPIPSSSSTKTTSTTIPRLSPTKNKSKVLPISSLNANQLTNSSNPLCSFTQFQLPPFNSRREKTSAFITSTSTVYNRTNTFLPTRIEPSIRKSSQYNEQLSVDATRWTTQTTDCETSKYFLSSPYGHFSQKSSPKKSPEINVSNISDQCLIDFPQTSTNNFNDKCSSLAQTRSSSSSIDDNDESTSSGIFTDERTDLNENHRTASKDTLSTLEILSIDSIVDSQISLNHCPPRYRLPMPTFDTIPNKPEIPHIRFQRAHSAEGILKDNHITHPVINKTRQSSAAIVKKIEKRIPTSRSPPTTLEKSGLKRIANDTYRLTIDKDEHLYHRQRQNSFVPYSDYDDSLPPANNEEIYATLPRISSTEQLNNNENIQNDLRAIVDDYLRPIVTSINKTTYRSTKHHHHHRSKRSQNTNEHLQININDLTDKLLSSIDCSIYAQYQRCY